MHKEEDLTPAERELESALGRLKPAASTLDRDELMFNAGRLAAGRARPWQIFSVVLMALLLCSVLIRPDIYGSRESSRPHDTGQLRIAQTTYQFILHPVYILILINHYELESLAQFIPHIGRIRQ